MGKIIRVHKNKMIKATMVGEPATPGYIQLTANMLKRTANLSDLTDVVEARKNLGVASLDDLSVAATPNSIVRRDENSRFKVLDAEATNEPVSLNQLNNKQYSLSSTNITGVAPINKGGTGKTTAAEAYAALGGRALGKLDSIALTDAKITGILPTSKGGTGTTDGFGWKNAYTDIEFNAKLGLSYPFTTQELATAISNRNIKKPIFCMVSGWNKGENRITDFPSSDLSHRTIINCADENQFYLETVDPFNLTTYICNVSGGVAGPWIKTRNADGSIPAEIISTTVLKYENSDGVWTETKLTTGEVMLEGWGQFVSDSSGHYTINYPKTIYTGVSNIIGIPYLYTHKLSYISTMTIVRFLVVDNTNNPVSNANVKWRIQTILAD